MVVKIRFGRGPVVARRKGKNSRIALLGAGFLTLVSICLASLGIWRFFQDVGLAGDFIFHDGFLSHWQVWLAATSVTWYSCWRLSQYAKQSRVNAESGAESGAESETEFGAEVNTADPNAPDSSETPAPLAAHM